MIPITEFGRDHWSTFGYIEVRIVDHGGIPSKRHLRCIHARHPLFAHEGGDASNYPTRLKGRTQPDHDDWDCLDDFEEAGLVTNIGTGVNRVYSLTDAGRDLAARLRAHKGQGGTWENFVNVTSGTPDPQTQGPSPGP